MKKGILQRKKRGISPVIAAIILIAVTIAIAIAVAAWVFGLFGGYVGGAAVEVKYGTSTFISEGGAPGAIFSFEFHNGGSSDVTIVTVDIGNLGTVDPALNLSSQDITGNADTIITDTGAFAWTNPPTAGLTYTITFTLSDGTVMPVVLDASA